jgi:hypothetical protein
VALHLSPELLATTPAGARLRPRNKTVLAVPEPAVIDTGALKVVFRESLPNTFEGVSVRLGSKMRDPDGATYYPVLSGLNEDDQVVTAGAFLLDAETRLNPALGSVYIGGSSGGKAGGVTVRPTTPDDEVEKVAAAMAKLSPEDRKLAQAQRFCPIRHEPLGSMGIPVKLMLNGKPVFVCCKGCNADALADPAKTLWQADEYRRKASPAAAPPAPPQLKLSAEELEDIRAGLAKLPDDDRKLAEAQRLCPVQGKPLGSMSKPPRVDLGNGKVVFVCCAGCTEKAKKDPDATLRKAEESKKLPPLLPGGKP